MKCLVGQFGGFPLRVSWLPRLVDQYRSDGSIPTDPETIAVDLGVGKNMAKSMRAWGRAAGIVGRNGDLTHRADQFFKEFDPYLEYGESVALLHWYIASNFDVFTVLAWFFNFHRDETLSVDEAVSGFTNYLLQKNLIYAKGTVRGDIEPLVRMYTPAATVSIDELGDRFFSKLGLVRSRKDKGQISITRSWLNERVHVSDRLIEYTILSCFSKKRITSSAFSSLYSGTTESSSPGKVFGLTKDGYFSAIERACGTSKSNIALSSMPGDDALVIARGGVRDSCALGDVEQIERHVFL